MIHKEKDSKMLKQTFVLLFYVLVVVFFLFSLKDINLETIRETNINLAYLFFPIPFSLIALFVYPYTWGRLIEAYGESVSSRSRLSYIYAKAWMGRYIPGKVAWLAGKVVFASGMGISKYVLGSTVMLEGLLVVFSGLGLGVGLIAVSAVETPLARWGWITLPLTLISTIIFFFPPIFSWLFEKAQKILKRQWLLPPNRIKYTALIQAFILYCGVLMLNGVSVYLIMKGLHAELDLGSYMYITGVAAFSGSMGILAIFAPGGIGVRDGILVILLSEIVPPEIAILTAMILRAWLLAVDLLFLIVAYIIYTLGIKARRITLIRSTVEKQ